MQKTSSWLRPSLFVLIAFLHAPGVSYSQGLSKQLQDSLAHRFRPFIKTTLDEGRDEPFHLVSWQWFISHSDLKGPSSRQLVSAEDLARDHLQLVLPSNNANLRIEGAGEIDPQLILDLDDDLRGGVHWTHAITSGDGIYAHVEEVCPSPLPNPNVACSVAPNIVSIEYTLLWSYNAAIWSNHEGDIATVTAVYDRGADLLTRLTFMIHGCAIESFRIAAPQSIALVSLDGIDQNLARFTTPAAKVTVAGENRHQSAGDCGGKGVCLEGSCHSPSDSYVFLSRDPVTQLYEHPVLYIEEGAHEPWPNPTGSISIVPAHTGDGVSFLPNRVNVLGTFSHPDPVHYPFIHFNGKFGNDPQAIALHNAWFWPEGRANNRFGIPENRFTDPDPYITYGALEWPPRPEYANGTATFHVFPIPPPFNTGGIAFDGSERTPFPDLMTAQSFVPRNAIVVMSPGEYPEPALLSRPLTITAPRGPATIGGARAE